MLIAWLAPDSNIASMILSILRYFINPHDTPDGKLVFPFEVDTKYHRFNVSLDTFKMLPDFKGMLYKLLYFQDYTVN